MVHPSIEKSFTLFSWLHFNRQRQSIDNQRLFCLFQKQVFVNCFETSAVMADLIIIKCSMAGFKYIRETFHFFLVACQQSRFWFIFGVWWGAKYISVTLSKPFYFERNEVNDPTMNWRTILFCFCDVLIASLPKLSRPLLILRTLWISINGKFIVLMTN